MFPCSPLIDQSPTFLLEHQTGEKKKKKKGRATPGATPSGCCRPTELRRALGAAAGRHENFQSCNGKFRLPKEMTPITSNKARGRACFWSRGPVTAVPGCGAVGRARAVDLAAFRDNLAQIRRLVCSQSQRGPAPEASGDTATRGPCSLRGPAATWSSWRRSWTCATSILLLLDVDTAHPPEESGRGNRSVVERFWLLILSFFLFFWAARYLIFGGRGGEPASNVPPRTTWNGWPRLN